MSHEPSYEFLVDLVYELRDRIQDLEYKYALIENEITLVKNEGCWIRREKKDDCE